jgi:hypothetical protein
LKGVKKWEKKGIIGNVLIKKSMKKIYCENCGKEVPQSSLVKISTEKEFIIKDDDSIEIKETPIEPFSRIDSKFLCSCGETPNSIDTFYEIKFCSGCGKSVGDKDFVDNHLIDWVDEETGEIFNFCKISDSKTNCFTT